MVGKWCGTKPSPIEGVFDSDLLGELWKESRVHSKCIDGEGTGLKY